MTRTARLQTFPGAVAAPLTFKICRRNEYKLLMGPFGSDQSRHVDDFGAKKISLTILLRKVVTVRLLSRGRRQEVVDVFGKKSNVDDFVAKKSSF